MSGEKEEEEGATGHGATTREGCAERGECA